MGANARRQPDCFNFSLLLFSLLRFPPFLLVLEFCVVDYFTDRRLGVGSDFNQIKPVFIRELHGFLMALCQAADRPL